MTELQGLQLRIDEFRQRGCAVAGVVPDPPEVNAQVVADLGLGFSILADPDFTVIDAFSLRHDGGSHDGQPIARSASVLIDADGVVRWRHVTDNLRRRPDPSLALAALDELSTDRTRVR